METCTSCNIIHMFSFLSNICCRNLQPENQLKQNVDWKQYVTINPLATDYSTSTLQGGYVNRRTNVCLQQLFPRFRWCYQDDLSSHAVAPHQMGQLQAQAKQGACKYNTVRFLTSKTCKFLQHSQSRKTDKFMNSLISSWTKDADWSSFACYAHQILELSHCRRNPGICRAMPLYLFKPTAPHTRGRSLQPHSPGEGWFRQRDSCAQLQPKGTALWAHICCTIHEAGACLIASSSQ